MRTKAVAIFASLLLSLLAGSADVAFGATGPYLFTYGGRLANAQGEAIEGPVEIELRFYRTAAGGTAIPVSPIVRTVPLADGVFQIDVSGWCSYSKLPK